MTPGQHPDTVEVRHECPQCHEPVAATDDFCEACGQPLHDGAEAAPAPQLAANGRTCAECGGKIDDDGFCTQCGAKARSPRDHWSESPAPELAGVCDRGIVHARNEDAMALGTGPDIAVIVVCDGVTSAPDSDRAALAAAKAARDLLLDGVPPAPAAGAAFVEHWSGVLTEATDQANRATVAVAHSLGDPPEAPSCTFVAAVASAELAVVGWCGDSRAYWLPDGGEPQLLTVDHSLGTEMIRAGKTREEAEADPAFHTITRWLGADSPTPQSELSSVALGVPGWLVVCSDGLWNYLSDPVALQREVAECAAAGAAGAAPLAVAEALIAFANEQGGHDNITAALLRHD
jgi:serine/threonine protein phosphatase PrpC